MDPIAFISSNGSQILKTVLWIIIGIIALKQIVIIPQGRFGVVTRLGQFHRVLRAGMNFKCPFIDRVAITGTLQNLSDELEFEAISLDQATVTLDIVVVSALADDGDESVKRAAYAFDSSDDFKTAFHGLVESTIRGLVAKTQQQNVLGLRSEINDFVTGQIQFRLAEWGHQLIDLQVREITFNEEITTAMNAVVASLNKIASATNEGAALLIEKTKEAEAQGAAIKIAAMAEAEASRLRGIGAAAFREEVSKGMASSAELLEKYKLDVSLIAFSMWIEGVKHVAEHGTGNMIMFDGSAEGLNRTMRQTVAALKLMQTERDMQPDAIYTTTPAKA